MYEDIFELVTIAARKRNLKESTANAYCHALRPFLNAVNKPWQELTIIGKNNRSNFAVTFDGMFI